MGSRPESDEALVRRMLPAATPNRFERQQAWAEWHTRVGEAALRKYIGLHNTTAEADEDILQDALLTAYLEVERGRYEQREGVPFTAYVKGIARNKLREARHRPHWLSLDAVTDGEAEPPAPSAGRQVEADCERRERQAILHRGLAALQGERRQVLERCLRGDSTDEIAAELAVSEAVVRQHKCRGLRQMRLNLGLEGEGMWAGTRTSAAGEQRSPVPACPDGLTRSWR